MDRKPCGCKGCAVARREVALKILDLHKERTNRFHNRPTICNHCAEMAGDKEYEFLSSYPCDTAKLAMEYLNVR